MDEALKLARVVELDFDQQVKNQICEVKSSDVVLWDRKTRQAKGKLGPMGDACMLNMLRQAAAVVRDQNTGGAKKAIEHNGLLDDATLLKALEDLLNVLPAVASSEKGPKLDASLAAASGNWDALEKLRGLAFAEQVSEPARQLLLPMATTDEMMNHRSIDHARKASGGPSMRTIETIVTVNERGIATLRMPPDVTPGEHKVVVLIDQATKQRVPLAFSSHDVGPWPLAPGETFGREDLYDDDDH